MGVTDRRRQQGELTRGRIIDAAYQIIGECGQAGLTTKAIITVAGISKGSLYHHFASLQDVVDAVLREVLGSMFQELHPADYDDFNAYLDAFELAYFDGMLADRHLSQAFYGYVPVCMFEDRYRPILAQLLRDWFQQFGETVNYYMGGGLSLAQRRSIVRLVDATMTGLGIHWFSLEQHRQTRADWQLFRAMLTQYLEALVQTGASQGATPQ